MGCVIGDEIIERDKRDLFLCDHSYLDEQYKGTCCFFSTEVNERLKYLAGDFLFSQLALLF